ncbi:hypothetical protein N2152v2_002018 [Parachlorella kessleri]
MADDLTEYERQRAERIAKNIAVLQQLQVPQLAAELSHAVETAADGLQKKRKQPRHTEQPASLRPRSARAAAARAASRLARQHGSEAGSSGSSDVEESEGDDDKATSGSEEDSGREGRSRRHSSSQQDTGKASDEYEPDSGNSSGVQETTSGSAGPSEAEGADSGAELDATAGGSTRQVRQPQQQQRQRRRASEPSHRSKRVATAAVQPGYDRGPGAASGEDGLVGDDEDWELQQALALSLAEFQGGSISQEQQNEQRIEQQQQQQEQPAGHPPVPEQQHGEEARGHAGTPAGTSTAAAPAATATAPAASAAAILSLDGASSSREAGSAPPLQARPGFKEDRATAAAVAAALAPMGFASRARWRKRQQQAQQAEQGSTALPPAGTSRALGGSTNHKPQEAAADAAPANDEKGKTKKGEARKRPKKLPAFDPTPEEVHSSFALLAAQGGGRVTAAALLKVATTLGIEVDEPQVGDMLRLAADRLAAPGLGSGGGCLILQQFQQLVELFRVKE